MEPLAEFAAFSRLALYYMQQEDRTVADIARLLHVHRSTAHRWMHGSAHMPKDRIEEFCKKLHLSEEDCEQLTKLAGYIVARPNSSVVPQEESEILHILRKYIQKELDFVACYHRGILDHVVRPDLEDRLKRIFIATSSTDQGELYRKITEDTESLIDQLDAVLKPIRQGKLIRVVLDTEVGGAFYYYVSEGVYVSGFTTKQTSMEDNSSDEEMKALKDEIKSYMGIQ